MLICFLQAVSCISSFSRFLQVTSAWLVVCVAVFVLSPSTFDRLSVALFVVESGAVWFWREFALTHLKDRSTMGDFRHWDTGAGKFCASMEKVRVKKKAGGFFFGAASAAMAADFGCVHH